MCCIRDFTVTIHDTIVRLLYMYPDLLRKLLAMDGNLSLLDLRVLTLLQDKVTSYNTLPDIVNVIYDSLKVRRRIKGPRDENVIVNA